MLAQFLKRIDALLIERHFEPIGWLFETTTRGRIDCFALSQFLMTVVVFGYGSTVLRGAMLYKAAPGFILVWLLYTYLVQQAKQRARLYPLHASPMRSNLWSVPRMTFAFGSILVDAQCIWHLDLMRLLACAFFTCSLYFAGCKLRPAEVPQPSEEGAPIE